MNATVSGAGPNKRTPLLLLALLFFAPLLFSFWVYYGSRWRPSGRTNHGVLIEPAITLPPVPLPRIDLAAASNSNNDVPAAADILRGKWSLVYIAAGDCDADCRDTLYYMRQTHLGLGNLIPRVQRVFLASQPCCDRKFSPQMDAAIPAVITLNAAGTAASQLLAQFPSERRATTIFIVDPRGNLMMRYDAKTDPKGLRDDLKKLLNLSHIG